MDPSFCPAFTTILLHLPLSSAKSLQSPTTHTLMISLLTQFSHLNRGLPLFLLPFSPQSICSFCQSLPTSTPSVQPISAGISPISPSSSSAHQSPLSVHPSYFYPPSSLPQCFCTSCSHKPAASVVVSQSVPHFQTVKAGQHYT